MNINLYINKQSARAQAPEIFSGSVGVLTVTLFGELDSSLVTALRFMHESGDGYYTAVLENGSAVVPHEVIKAPGFSIAVAGYENDGDTVVRFLPSEAVYIPVKENGYGNPDDAVSEEGEAKSLIGQILSECTETREEALLAQEKLSQSYKSEQEKLSQSYNTAAIVLEEKCNENKAYIDEKSEELTNNLGSEKTQRETADDALLLRISEEEEAREAADSELEERIINTERGIAAVRDELEADIKDNLSGYVKKEDGKGLSKVVDVAMNTLNTEGLGRFDELNFVFADGSTDAVAYYNVTQMKAMLEEDVIEVDEKLEGKIDKKEVSESDIDSLSNVLGLSFYKVNPINGSFEHSYFMINSMDSGIGIVAATCFQMRFKETIETRIYDVETETWGNWTEISGSSGSLGSPLLDGVDLNQVFDAGMYVVGYTCTNLPDAIDFEVLDSPVVTMFVGYSEDEYYDLAHQIIFVTDCVGNSCVYQRQIERYKSSGSVTPYDWGTISSGGSGGGADLSDYYTKSEVEAYIEETLLGGAW